MPLCQQTTSQRPPQVEATDTTNTPDWEDLCRKGEELEDLETPPTPLTNEPHIKPRHLHGSLGCFLRKAFGSPHT